MADAVSSAGNWPGRAARVAGCHLPARRLAVEAGSVLGWCEWVGDEGAVIGVTRFGASAPYKENFKHYGFTVENVVAKARALL